MFTTVFFFIQSSNLSVFAGRYPGLTTHRFAFEKLYLRPFDISQDVTLVYSSISRVSLRGSLRLAFNEF